MIAFDLEPWRVCRLLLGCNSNSAQQLQLPCGKDSVCVCACVCVFVILRDQTRHPTRPTTTAPASPVLGFISLNKGVGSCIPSYGTDCDWALGVGWGAPGAVTLTADRGCSVSVSRTTRCCVGVPGNPCQDAGRHAISAHRHS